MAMSWIFVKSKGYVAIGPTTALALNVYRVGALRIELFEEFEMPYPGFPSYAVTQEQIENGMRALQGPDEVRS